MFPYIYIYIYIYVYIYIYIKSFSDFQFQIDYGRNINMLVCIGKNNFHISIWILLIIKKFQIILDLQIK